MENETPPIFGKNAEKFLQRMEKQRVEMGEIIKPSEVAKLFDDQRKLPHQQVVSLLRAVRDMFDKEPNILSIDAPVIVVGDIHGQYFDLRQIVKLCGKPMKTARKVRSGLGAISFNSKARKLTEAERPKTIDSETILFLGNYINRGLWSCEVLFYLLSMKVHYPDTVIMLRGNHECDTMAETYGFREECEHKYGREVYHRCVQVFSCLPIACLINLPNGKRLLGCHGGFSDKISTLEQIAKVERRREPGIEGILCDLLWSDPVPDNVVEEYKLPMAFENIDFIPNETRGCAKKFGYRALERFLTDNQLVGIVRGHEAKEEGFQFHFQNAGTKNHLCITVSSAPNRHDNKGAVLLIHRTVKDRLMHQIKHLKKNCKVEQIFRQPDRNKDDYLDLIEPICYNGAIQPQVVAFDNQNMNILQEIEETCPYMPTVIEDFYNSVLDILDNHGDAQEQLETYRREQNLKMLDVEKVLDEPKDEDFKDKGLKVGDVTFNGEERLMLHRLFLMNDFDDSGLITARSIIEWAREEGKLMPPELVKKVISVIDYDNDGAIGLRDFFQYAAKLKEEFLSEEFEDDEYDDIDDEVILMKNQEITSNVLS